MTNGDCGNLRLLPGKTSARLVIQGLRVMVCAAPIAPMFAFESKFGRRENLYIVCVLVVGCILLFGGFAIAARGYRKRDLEIERGYSSWANLVRENNGLVGIDANTAKVLPTSRRLVE